MKKTTIFIASIIVCVCVSISTSSCNLGTAYGEVKFFNGKDSESVIIQSLNFLKKKKNEDVLIEKHISLKRWSLSYFPFKRDTTVYHGYSPDTVSYQNKTEYRVGKIIRIMK